MAIRTALLTNFVPPYRIKLLNALRERVGELKIFVSTQMEGDRPWVVNNDNLDVVSQKTITFNRTRRHPDGFIQQLYIHFPYDTLYRLWKYSPRIVISSELGLRTLQAAIYRLLFPRCRLIVWATLSEDTERGWGIVRQILRRVILKSADAVICNGPSGARYITSFGFPAAQTVIVNQPIDLDLFTILPLAKEPETARRIVFSGRLIAQKAVLEMQEAMVHWAGQNPTRKLELIWIGDGVLRERLENAQVPKNFQQTFLGNRPYDALPEIYASCGALILPSLMDEWGLVVNEAMASGLVVLGSIYSQAAIEMVRDDQTGWLIDPLRPVSIEHALDKLFSTPVDTLLNMRDLARQRALMITPEGAADHVCSAISLATQDTGRGGHNRKEELRSGGAGSIAALAVAPINTAQ